MSKLSAFLNPVSYIEEKEVIISKRFLDENGEPVPFKIKSLTQAENEAISKASRKYKKINGKTEEGFDPEGYTARLVVAATVFPDFSSSELCQKYGTLDPTEVPGKMLLSGEYKTLVKQIMDLSGFGDEDLEEEAKN